MFSEVELEAEVQAYAQASPIFTRLAQVEEER